ncbi:MAG TPA: DUF3300 domain-containing protein [Syntrophales bacterium]|nr:DUF3300 domain-containing protein [Syntrophorhabdaceae bacterium]HVO66205.1 DUF3300 domain-containing protein [Syntrophales bacterium]
MNKGKTKSFLFTLLACLSLTLAIGTARDSSAAYLLTEQELDDLLAPVALYPDPLLAQMLPASTYPEEVADAADWLRSGGDPSRIDEENWDENVRAITHYPEVLYMMADNMDWTSAVGDAFLNQPKDVTNSIQRLRWRAQNLGNLNSNDQQTVTTEGNDIQIVPAQPQYIYVPQYDPSVVYVQGWSPGIPPFATFGLGLLIGSWLDLDFDWGRHHVFYHGWNRPGWVNNARPYVHVKNVYVQRSRPYINQTWRHDPSHGDPGKYWASRPVGTPSGRYPHTTEVRGRGSPLTGPARNAFAPKTNVQQFTIRGKDSRRTAGPQPVRQTPVVSPRPAVQAPVVSPRPAVQAPAVFGGYRGPNEVKTQSMRGQTSRQSNVGVYVPSTPVKRGNVPTGGGASSSGKRRN